MIEDEPAAAEAPDDSAVPARPALLDRLRDGEPWDLFVVGGGATGLGTAVDAARRGYRTLLLDAHDFAKGTSSRSTKLVHGGVRYLAQGNLGLVREALRERGLLLANAPHLVRMLPFIVPAYRWWALPYYGLGLALYDLLAGRRRRGRSRPIGRAEVLRHAPTLEPAGLRGGVLYHDAQFDDARLAIALLRTFLDLGGTALNYVAVRALRKQGGRLCGAVARDIETDEEFPISAKAVVNATGVFADTLRRLDEPGAAPIVRPSQGAHLVLDRAFLPGDSAIMIPRTDDGRVLFAIPWLGRVLVGTTDTPIDTLPDEPRPLPDEVEFLLAHAARYLTRDPGPSDVRSTFAGLRPLLGSNADLRRSTATLPREHAVLVSRSGLITITGGKWTTYRRMGADAVDRAAAVADLPRRPCTTETLRLHGWQPDPQPAGDPLAPYGSDAPALRRLIAETPAWSEPLHPALPYLAGEVVWAARFEMACTVEDVLARRTRALLLDARASRDAAPRVAALLAEERGQDPSWQDDQVRRFRDLARGYLPE